MYPSNQDPLSVAYEWAITLDVNTMAELLVMTSDDVDYLPAVYRKCLLWVAARHLKGDKI